MKKKQRKKIRAPSGTEVVLVISSVILTLGMTELGSRTWLNYFATPEQYREYVLFRDVPTRDFQWTRHHYLNYFPTPNYKLGLTYHNSLGYRDREFSLVKPPGVFRIVALGGSTTYTSRVEDNEKTFTAQLEKVLVQKYGYKNVEAINAGVVGYSSWESLINLEFRVLDVDPDLIIVYHATNDVQARLVDPSAYRGDNSGRRKDWSAPPLHLFDYSYLYRILSIRL